MNSRTGWGIQIRSNVHQFVRNNGGVATTKEITNSCGNEAGGQLKRMVEEGQLERVKRGVYKYKEPTIVFF